MGTLLVVSSVWVLTSSYNDYNQHGEYFEHVFLHKPCIQILSDITSITDKLYLKHIWYGGGRLNNEDKWYSLEEIELTGI